MKKLLLILLCLPMIGFGQDGKLEIGFVNGITSSSIHGDLKDLYDNSSMNVSSMQRANAGFMLQYNISDLLSINSKLLYQVKGWCISGEMEITTVDMPDGSLGTYNIDASIYNDYISLPIVMKVNIGNQLRGTINTGFYTSYLLEVVHSDLTFGDMLDPQRGFVYPTKGNTQRATDLDNKNRLDFGFIFGGGISYLINDRIRFSFDSNLEYGLINKNIQESSLSNYNIAYNFLFGCSYLL